MDGAMVVVMMMAGAGQMVDLVRDIEDLPGRIPAALHRKAMQGQQQHQEQAEEAAHGNIRHKNRPSISEFRFARQFPFRYAEHDTDPTRSPTGLHSSTARRPDQSPLRVIAGHGQNEEHDGRRGDDKQRCQFQLTV